MADTTTTMLSRKTASQLIEVISSKASSSASVFVYDLAEQVGFGLLTKSLVNQSKDIASVVSMQTRAGAGLSLVGRLSQSTSQDGAKGSVLTAYTSPIGLAGMVPSLVHLPAPAPDCRLVLQVPTATAVGDKFAISPTLAPLNSALPILPDSFSVILSATPQESVDFAVAAYQVPTHVIHFFDHYSGAREVGDIKVPTESASTSATSDIKTVLGQVGYAPFDYVGDKDAHTVLVLLNGPMALAVKAVTSYASGLGVLIVRILRPWDEEAFRAVLPSTAKAVYVIEDVPAGVARGMVYSDVFSGLFVPGSNTPAVYSKVLDPVQAYDYLNNPPSLADFISATISQPLSLVETTLVSKMLLFSVPGTTLADVALRVEETFSSSDKLSSRLVTEFDVFSRPGGVKADRILLAPKNAQLDFAPLPFAIPLSAKEGSVNFLAVLDQSLLKSHIMLEHAKPGAVALVVTSWTAEELVEKLHPQTLALAKARKIRLCTIDAKAVASKIDSAAADSLQALVVHVAFLRLYFGMRATEEAVLKVAHDQYGRSAHGADLKIVNVLAWSALKEVDLTDASVEVEGSPLKDFGFNIIAVSDDGDTTVNGAKIGSWHDAAKHLLFPSAFTPPVAPSEEPYPQIPSLRPEVPERTYLITTVVKRRLTPLDYDRNVMHIEFDTSGTGLKYAIGEALGVHGWNDENEVLEFCHWYGVDPSRLITLPVPGDETKMHTRTIFQALQQQIDLFGKPPKSFFADLAEYAADTVDRHALQFIGSAEGSSTFKKLSEKDTVTFADVLRMYKSARPGIEVLCEMVGDVKPRHYSIASAQSVVGDRVDLLVVTVEWSAPSGSPRYGQCTRYLNSLQVGQKVTVSIKPSVMKLPPSDSQPIIMAGLGTGAAPFRAFLQHRAMLAEQNISIGPMYYYFGSRHRSQEYLYGEELEAFLLDGVLTKLGLAFSRDQPKKIYIQDKMLEDAPTLARMLHQDKGYFYLCGPTWPVPDVFEALRSALVKHHDHTLESAADFLESLKEEERYVLEVY
ncbi:assimilatory sulfite reductase [Vararia minispora EC-137]|uniref:Assimilatory sulfite reductase n=1 Tax=Vararia minispora EC-137 TaxID=1314806 RepID=A0ACB8QPT7_9AGAM|nr:assimilatory sulfite reductase [Vararia minispora EC-137]